MSSLINYITGISQDSDCKDKSAGECKQQSLFSRIKAFLYLQKIIQFKKNNNKKIKIIKDVGILKVDIMNGVDTTQNKKPVLSNIEKSLGIEDGLHIKISNDNLVQKSSETSTGTSITNLNSINLISHVGFKNIKYVKQYLTTLMKDGGFINEALINVKNNTENNNMLLLDNIVNKNILINKKKIAQELKNNNIHFFDDDDIKFYPKMKTVNIMEETIIKNFNKNKAPSSLYFVVFNADMSVNTENGIPDESSNIQDIKEGFDSSLNLLNASALQALQTAQQIQKPQPAQVTPLQQFSQPTDSENVTYMDITPEQNLTTNILNSIDDDANATQKINKEHKRFVKLQKKQLKLIKKENKKKEKKLNELSQKVDTNETLTRFEEYKMKHTKGQITIIKMLVVGLTACVVLVVLQRTFLKYIIPNAIFEGLLSLVVVLTIYYLGKAIIDFSNRSTLNFDEYKWHNNQTNLLNRVENNYASYEDDIKDDFEHIEENDELILKFSGTNDDVIKKSIEKLKTSKDIISSLNMLGNNVHVDVVNDDDIEKELKHL